MASILTTKSLFCVRVFTHILKFQDQNSDAVPFSKGMTDSVSKITPCTVLYRTLYCSTGQLMKFRENS